MNENAQNSEDRLVQIYPWIKTDVIIKLLDYCCCFNIFSTRTEICITCVDSQPNKAKKEILESTKTLHIRICYERVFAFWLLILALALWEGHWIGSRMLFYSLVSQTKAEVWQVRKGESNWIHLCLPPTLTHATMPHKEEEDTAPKISSLLYLLPI